MRNIVLLGLQTDANLGDVLISQCTEYLTKKALIELGINDIKICQVDMRGFDYQAYIKKDDLAVKKAEERWFFLYRIERKLVRIFVPHKLQAVKDKFETGKKKRNSNKEKRRQLYKKRMSSRNARVLDENTAALIIVGGGFIKYGHNQRLADMMSAYINRANRLNIPVMFNSVGIEGYAADNEECKELCRILNLPCVKTVTTRDDIDTLNNCYITSSHVVTAKTPDPAVWASEVYPRERASNAIIGLGMARGGLYRDHGGEKGTKDLLKLWSEIISELDRRGYAWRLFSNGLQSDWKFGAKLLDHIGRTSDTELLLPNPTSVDELINIICSFDCVAASRLHAGITAYSYGIPVVEIVWNVKQRMFAEWVGCNDRFIDESKVTAAEFVDAIERAVSSPAPTGAINRNDTYGYIRSFIKENV